MTKKTISQLDDILLTQESSAVVAIEQNGSTFKAPVRPNPPRQINVLSQAQLEAELGTDLEIPDGDDITIIMDDSFTQTKPIKIGTGCVVEIYASTINTTITYTGTGAFTQNTDPLNAVRSVFIHDISVNGNVTNRFLDLFGTSRLFLTDIRLQDFDSIGIVNFPFYRLLVVAGVDCDKGLVVRNPIVAVLTTCSIRNSVGTFFTFLSFISDNESTTPVTISCVDIFGVTLFTDDSLLYIDPKFITGSLTTVEKSISLGGDLYQIGPTLLNLQIFSVEDNGSGKTRFTTISPHHLVDQKPVTLNSFIETTYNKTRTVLGVPVSATEFDLDIPFVGSDIGILNTHSNNEKSIQVKSENNQGEPDSMFTGDAGLEVFGTPIISSSLVQDAFEVITSASWAFNNLERFSIGVNNEGQLVADEPSAKKYKVDYSATLEKSGGGSLDIGIVILKNGGIISFNAPHTVNSGLVQVSGSDIVELVETDTIQIAVINYNSTAAVINTSQVNMVINKA